MCSLLKAFQSSRCPVPDAVTQGQQGRAVPNAPGDAAQTCVTNLYSKQLSKSSFLVRNLSDYPQASFLLCLWRGAWLPGAGALCGAHGPGQASSQHRGAICEKSPRTLRPPCGAAPAQQALLPLPPKSSSNSTDVAVHFSSHCPVLSKNEKCQD